LVSFAYFVFSILFSCCMVLYLNTPSGMDSWFHLKYSSLMFHSDYASFPWLPYTIYDEYFPDHHYGFHIFLSVLSLSDDLLVNAYIFLICQTVIIIYMLLYIVSLLTNNLKPVFYLPVIFLYFGTSLIWDVRLFMVRAHSISIVLITLFIIQVLKNKNIYMLFISCIICFYFNLHFLYLPFVVCIKNVISYQSVKVFRDNLIFTFLGGMLGLCMHPNMYQTILYTYFYLYKKTFLPADVTVGLEWYPLSLSSYFSNTFTLLLYIYAVIFLPEKDSIIQKENRFIITILLCLTLSSFSANRHIELLVTPAFCFGVASLIDWLGRQKRSVLFYVNIYLITLLMMYVTLIRTNNILMKYDFKSLYFNFIPASEWIEKNINHNDAIINLNWSLFPILVTQNENHRYVWGLDPKYLYYKDRKLFDSVYSFLQNDYSARDLLQIFNSKILIISIANPLNDSLYYNKLANDTSVQLLFKDENYAIFGILNDN